MKKLLLSTALLCTITTSVFAGVPRSIVEDDMYQMNIKLHVISQCYDIAKINRFTTGDEIQDLIQHVEGEYYAPLRRQITNVAELDRIREESKQWVKNGLSNGSIINMNIARAKRDDDYLGSVSSRCKKLIASYW